WCATATDAVRVSGDGGAWCGQDTRHHHRPATPCLPQGVPMPIDLTFPSRLRELRQQAGMSLRKLASAVPCSHVYIHQLEQGTRTVSPQIAQRLDTVLNAGGALTALVGCEPDRLQHIAANPR